LLPSNEKLSQAGHAEGLKKKHGPTIIVHSGSPQAKLKNLRSRGKDMPASDREKVTASLYKESEARTAELQTHAKLTNAHIPASKDIHYQRVRRGCDCLTGLVLRH